MCRHDKEVSGAEVTELRPENKSQREMNLTLHNYLHEKKRGSGRDVALNYC